MIIETPSRLHVTLIDLNGAYGRIDGGVGITLQKPKLQVKAETIESGIEVVFSEKEKLESELMDDYTIKIKKAALKMVEHLKINEGFTFTVDKTYPSHSGLGSGTQLSLAAGKLISKMNGLDLTSSEIASIVGRGGTSGIGVAAFDKGGFIVDGGHNKAEKPGFLPSSASHASPPPIIARHDFPEDWKIVLVIPNVEHGASGSKEVNIFQSNCPIPLGAVEKLTHVLLMKMLPAVVEADLDSFGSAINMVQNVGFKRIEHELQNPRIKEIMNSLTDAGAAGVGMSSFGPTLYAVTDTNATDISRAAEEVMKDVGGKIIITKAQNNGATLSD